MAKPQRYVNREISWLAFNARVLQEAQDATVPLLERLKFLGIFSNNLDEFYRVRIAALKRIMKLGSGAKLGLHQNPAELLDEIQRIAIQQNEVFEATYKSIRRELRQHHVHLINEQKLSPTQSSFVKNFFAEKVRPALVPIMLDQVQKFPYLKDSAIYLAIKLSVATQPKSKQFSLVEVPSNLLSRFVVLPSNNQNKYIILLEDIIRHNLKELYSNFDFDTFDAFTVKLTRDQQLDLDSDISHSLMEKIAKSVKNRQKGSPVRFVYDRDIAPDLLDFFRTKMKLHKYDNLIPAGRYHNFKDFISFPSLGLTHLRYAPVTAIPHPHFQRSRSAFEAIRAQDILLHYPYQSFSHLIDLLREAAIDPTVRSIKMTLYRAAKKSHVINALVNAARNGKQVTVVVELQARFDEEANINWAHELADEGINVIYGVPNLKVHAKLVLIERLEGAKKQLYVNVSTGNYNEVTATMYGDDSLFTADKRISTEVRSVFEFFEKNFLVKNYKHLILSPNRTRNKMIKLIDNEIKNAHQGKPSGIILKLNSLVDEHIIDWLYKASAAGVPIQLIVRGMCALVPGVKGLSENINVVSIIDRFLEHSRVFRFENGGKALYYISSADMMARNLDLRLEVSCPIYDVRLQSEIQMMLDVQLSDNVKARIINPPKNRATLSQRSVEVRSQFVIYDKLKVVSQKM